MHSSQTTEQGAEGDELTEAMELLDPLAPLDSPALSSYMCASKSHSTLWKSAIILYIILAIHV